MTTTRLVAWRRWRGQWAVLLGLSLSVGLGVGANIVVVDSVHELVRADPLQATDGSQFARLHTLSSASGRLTRGASVSYPVLDALRADSLTVGRVGAYSSVAVDVEVGERIVRSNAAIVSEGFFDVLGIAPAIGRLSGQDWSASGVAISHRFWQDQLRTTPVPLGSHMRIADREVTIVAVLPRDFAGLDFERVDLWMPLSAASAGLPTAWKTNSASAFLRPIARIRPGISLNQAATRLSELLTGAAVPSAQKGTRLSVVAERLARTEGSAQQRLDMISWVLIAVSALLLIAAAANVAGVLLSRVMRNERELAVRRALGATAKDLLLVLISDALPVVILGTTAGALGALIATDQVRANALPALAWRDSTSPFQVVLLGGLLGMASLGALLWLPWRTARQTSLNAVLSVGAFGSTSHRSRSRSLLIGVQTGGATLLIAGSILFIRTFQALGGERLGFNADQVGIVDFGNSADTVPIATMKTRLSDFASRVRSLSGVVDAGVASGIPLRQSSAASIAFKGTVVEPLSTGGPYVDALDSRALLALGARLVRGRLLAATDVAGSDPVVLVNETMARSVWGSANPLGNCLYFRVERKCRVVVGVLHDIQRDNVLEGKTLQTFIPLEQAPDYMRPRAVFVRALSPAKVRPLLRRLAVTSDLTGMPYRYDTFRDGLGN